jgi:hypothetical protein
MALRVIWQLMGRSVTPKILHRTKRSWGSYDILGVTDRSINCHLAKSAMHYLLCYTQPTHTTSISWVHCMDFPGFISYWTGLLTKTKSVNKNVKYNIRESSVMPVFLCLQTSPSLDFLDVIYVLFPIFWLWVYMNIITFVLLPLAR